ncbi:MAG: hypothetical protein A2X49_04505 [Lentisphaerae bacterium GWF2_52_8]|nr:MAG: hypothetical protein A2X49_04505 [Lentisphaerae bacterium GWF2_52_8]
MNPKPIISLIDGGKLRIHIPMEIKRKYGRKQIIAPEALDGTLLGVASKVQTVIVEAIAKAHAWTEQLESGKVENVSALSQKLHLCRPYVMRIISLVNLAPDIVERILSGTEPEGLTLDKLIKGLPEDWNEQRKALLPSFAT